MMRDLINLVESAQGVWGANASPEELEDYATGWDRGMGAAEHPEACKEAAAYDWRFEPAYPLAKIDHNGRMTPEKWASWMAGEFEDAKLDGDGREEDYQRIFDAPLREPIILVEGQHGVHITDGCHRVGAFAMMGRPTIPAVVGTPKAISESADQTPEQTEIIGMAHDVAQKIRSSFNYCKQASKMLAAYLKDCGYEPKVLRCSGLETYAPKADKRWTKLGKQMYWVHYVVMCEGLILDVTRQQFFPDATKVAVFSPEELKREWLEISTVPDEDWEQW